MMIKTYRKRAIRIQNYFPEEIKQYEHDGIIITSYAFEDEILEKLAEIDYPIDRVEKFLQN